MKIPAPFVLAAATIILINGLGAAAAPENPPPNIVVILADDLGYGDLGCYGAKVIPTPNIDRLAAHGLRFTQGYAPSSTCTPSRYSLLTGEYAWRQPPKKTSILDGDAPLAIDPARPTIASFLRAQGYVTGLIGKWHLGLGDGVTPVDFNRQIAPGPLQVGFDSAFFFPATLDRVPCVYIDNDRVAGLDPSDPISVSYVKHVGKDLAGHEHPELLKYPADPQHSDTIINGVSRIGYMAGGVAARWVDEDMPEVLVHRADKFIQVHRDHPFFLYFATQDPHVPHLPNARFSGKSGAGIRGDAIVQLDWMVGEVLDSLRKNGVAGRTLVIFSSDNGPVLFDGYFDGSAEANGAHQPTGGLRGWKYLRYEGGTRVPFIASWPGKIKTGVSDARVSLLDLYPSFAALLGKPYPASAGRDGENLLPALLGKPGATGRTSLVEHGIGNVLALRDGNWKYIPANADTSKGIGRGANPHDTRFVEARVTEDLLFNLANDPTETKNLAASHPAKLAELRAELARIRQQDRPERLADRPQ